MIFSKSLLVALFTWLLGAFGGALIMSFLTVINLLSESSEFSYGESNVVIVFFGLTLWISLGLLVITVPLNMFLLILTKNLLRGLNSSFKTFFLLSASTILSPFIIAILPYTRSLFFQNTLYFAFTISGFVLVIFDCFMLVKNFRTSIIWYILLNLLFLFVLGFLSRQESSLNFEPLKNLWLCSIFHVPGTIVLVLFARQFKLLDNPDIVVVS